MPSISFPIATGWGRLVLKVKHGHVVTVGNFPARRITTPREIVETADKDTLSSRLFSGTRL